MVQDKAQIMFYYLILDELMLVHRANERYSKEIF
jgi:hypothetical protein